jgi:outer membrane protein assembly factor BamB
MNGHTMRTLTLLSAVFCVLLTAQQKTPPFWKYELPEDIKTITPIAEGAQVFLWSDEFAWLYETTSGKKIWSVEVSKYSEKALHHLMYDSLYLVSTRDTLLCYAIQQNRLLWKKQYPGIEQDRFSGMVSRDTLAILSFRTIDVGINLLTGRELWRTQVEYETDLVERGTKNSILLPAAGKNIVFTSDDDLLLYSLKDGKPVLVRKKSVPNSDLIQQKRDWFYIAPDESFALFILAKGVLAIDPVSGKELAFVPLDIDEDFNVLQPTAAGCVVFGEEKTIHISGKTGKVSELVVDVDAICHNVVVTVESDMFLVLSLKNKLLCVDLRSGKTIWQTAEKFPPAMGYIHRFVSSSGSTLLATYLDPSDDVKLYAMSIDVRTGKINYRTLVAHSDESLPKRTLPLAVKSLPQNGIGVSFGYDDAGFHYAETAADTSIHFLIHTSSEMIEPNTKRDGGEGYAIVNIATGKVEAKQYMKIAHDLSFNGGFDALAAPLTFGSVKFLPGNRNLVAIDTAAASLRWMLIEQDLSKSYVLDMALVDSVLYVRTGGMKKEITYDEKTKKIQTKVVWEEDDYTLLAVDPATGKIYWKKTFSDDPVLLFPHYSISRYITANGNVLYGSPKFLYAQSLQKKKADSLQWKFEFADSGIGKYSYDELAQSTTYWDNERITPGNSCTYAAEPSVSFSSRTIAGGKFSTGVSRTLQVNYCSSSNSLIAIGEDGIASIDPVNGRMKWYYEWDYSDDDIQYRPVFLNDHLFFFMNGRVDLLNLKNGKISASFKADKESGVFIMPNSSAVVLIYKDEVTGVRIP